MNAQQDGIVDEEGDSLYRLHAAHATHVNVLMEVELLLHDGLLRLAADVGVGAALGLLLLGLVARRRLQPVRLHVGAQVAQRHDGVLALQLKYLSDGVLSLQTYEVPHGESVFHGCFRLVVDDGTLDADAILLFPLRVLGLQRFRLLLLQLLVQLAAERGQLLAGLARLFLVGLRLADAADGVLNLCVRAFQKLVCLLLGLAQDGLAAGAELRALVLVVGDDFIQLLLLLADVLALLLPVALVAHDVLQVLVALDIVVAYDVRGIGNDLLGKPYLAGNLHSKRATRLPNLELEEWLHLGAVVEHGAVDDALVVLGKLLEVMVVRGDDAKGASVVDALQHGLGDGASDERVCAAAELVYEHQALWAAVAQHVLHVQQMAAVGAQVVLDALFVADVDEDVAEDAHAARLLHGDEHATLHHVLQQPHRLQTHRLAARIGTGDEQDALPLRQLDGEGYDLLLVPCQRLLEEGMHGIHPVQHGTGVDVGADGLHGDGREPLGADEVDDTQEVHRAEDVGDVGPHLGGELVEDADDFTLLLALQFAHAVVGLHHLGRLYEDRLARCRLVVDDALDFAL